MKRIKMLRAEQSRAEQSRAEQSRAEQRLDYSLKFESCQVFLTNWGRFYVALEEKDDDERKNECK